MCFSCTQEISYAGKYSLKCPYINACLRQHPSSIANNVTNWWTIHWTEHQKPSFLRRWTKVATRAPIFGFCLAHEGKSKRKLRKMGRFIFFLIDINDVIYRSKFSAFPAIAELERQHLSLGKDHWSKGNMDLGKQLRVHRPVRKGVSTDFCLTTSPFGSPSWSP